MPARTDLNRLAAARPAWLDRTESVIDTHTEDLMLREILATPRAAAAPAEPARRHGPRPALSPRPRRLTVTAGVTAGVAAVTAAAGVTAGLAGVGQHSAGPAHVVTVSDVARHTIAAATAATQSGIVGSRTVFAPGTAGSAAILDNWSYGQEVRAKWYNAHGVLTEDDAAVVTHGSRVRRFVEYDNRTWSQSSVPAAHYEAAGTVSSEVDQLLGLPAGTQPGSGPAALPSGPATAPASNGQNGRITRVRVDGRVLYQVTTRYSAGALENDLSPVPMFTNLEVVPNSTVPGAAIETVWIDAATFLPVRVRMTTPGGRFLVSETLSWLAPSRANLAVFSLAPVPAGFRDTQEADH